MSPRELLHQLPSVFNKVAAGPLRCTIQFIASESAYVTVADGTCTVCDGTAPDADLVVTLSDKYLVELLKGKLNPAIGLMLRKLKAEGNLDLGMSLTSLFDFSKL
ncbi:SCP2 sterol-binding domain-containing protein [Rhodoferax sp.]|uniref:SCP2 sterol-binding domain-containing protein n=1 Tax=Rhodoferax sp. TaxID=50421 RepID=UPI002842983E|nr:SCP2 sterol-binding domain-containing protein [Rhodoferax sp.]MDR3367564.1 SCP2 sterol-binding domain-containing protein [Rhodoferax sp.]